MIHSRSRGDRVYGSDLPLAKRGSTVLPPTLGTAAWKTKSVMGKRVEFDAVSKISVTVGFEGDREKLNSTFKPFLSNTVMLGIAVCV